MIHEARYRYIVVWRIGYTAVAISGDLFGRSDGPGCGPGYLLTRTFETTGGRLRTDFEPPTLLLSSSGVYMAVYSTFSTGS
jgi:hypothetical protein